MYYRTQCDSMRHHGHRVPLGASLVAMAVVVLLSTVGQPAQAEFLRTGVQVWTVATGTGTLEEKSSSEPDPDDLDDSSGLGVSAFGLVGIVDGLDTGLVLHYLATVEHVREDKTAFELGSETDLNLRIAYSLPVPAILVSVHGEGGVTFFSSADELPRLPIDRQDPDTLFKKSDAQSDDTGAMGYNAGAGMQLGYSIIPFFSVFVGIDFQWYSAQLFKGEGKEVGGGDFGDVTSTDFELNLTGTRLKLALGVEFNL